MTEANKEGENLVSNGRHILDGDDKFILTRIKSQLTSAIESLKKRNVRHVNIEIELHSHIKKVLNEE
jgi:hypothetical protein